MLKHAFLIMAHENFHQLSRLLRKIDHKDNTVFIHIDSKSKFYPHDIDLLRDSCVQSTVIFTERHRISWGGYSIINQELRLLGAALPMEFDYYHVMSGSDFLIKPMSAFHRFFEEHKGFEFVDFASDELEIAALDRVMFYHPFRDICGRNRRNILYWFEYALVLLQKKIFHINRLRKFPDIKIKRGSNWVSITHDFAEYLLSNEQFIKDVFSYSTAGDELFIQTILFDSPFANKIFSNHMREIDWRREGNLIGAPYTYTVDDLEMLMKSDALICRKVSDKTPEGDALINKLEEIT